jgi:uncharacterized protein (DUF2141 family)
MFHYLGSGKYRLFAVDDLNNDRAFNAATELVAMPSGDIFLAEGEKTVAAPFRLALWDSTAPSLEGIDVPDKGKVILHFDEPLDSISGVRTSSYRITASSDTSSAFELRTVSLGCTSPKEIILSTAPQEGRPYLISSSALMDLVGNRVAPLGARGEFVGSTHPDTTGPELMDLWPPDSAQGITWDALISLCFNEAPQHVSVETSFVLMDSVLGPVAGQFRWEHGARVTFVPHKGLEHGRLYTISLDAAGVMDLAGNAMGEMVVSAWFRTQEAEGLGSISGDILRQGVPDSGRVCVRAHGLGDRALETQVITRGQDYRFEELLPGRYLISAFLDLDENTRFSYGSPVPFVAAEPYWVNQDTVTVRARWETAGVDVVLRR